MSATNTTLPAARHHKPADTSAPVHDLIATRWSPRAFDSEHVLEPGALRASFEAARWAPSAGNVQPWRFIIARRGSESFNRIVAALMPGNQTWAASASALIANIAEVVDEEGNARPWAEYDLGQAVAYLTLQTEHEGLVVHQMGGFDREAIRSGFSLGEHSLPVSITAIGRPGDVNQLPTPLRERELAPRTRHAVESLIIKND